MAVPAICITLPEAVLMVLLVSTSVVSLPTSVAVTVGSVMVPVLVIVLNDGVVSTGLVSVFPVRV